MVPAVTILPLSHVELDMLRTTWCCLSASLTEVFAIHVGSVTQILMAKIDIVRLSMLLILGDRRFCHNFRGQCGGVNHAGRKGVICLAMALRIWRLSDEQRCP
jgi:hypothetical protein